MSVVEFSSTFSDHFNMQFSTHELHCAMPSNSKSLDIKKAKLAFFLICLSHHCFMVHDLITWMQIIGRIEGQISRKNRARNHFSFQMLVSL